MFHEGTHESAFKRTFGVPMGGLTDLGFVGGEGGGLGDQFSVYTRLQGSIIYKAAHCLGCGHFGGWVFWSGELKWLYALGFLVA